MEEPFKPLSLSIKELFGNTDSLYKIPQYQRPYKWEDDQYKNIESSIYGALDAKKAKRYRKVHRNSQCFF